jgi:hypothetical protein
MTRARSGSIWRKSLARACREISARAQQAALNRRITFSFGLFKSDEHLSPDRDRVLHRLEAARVRFPLVVSEVGGPRAGRDDEGVIRHLAIGKRHAFLLRVDRGRLREEDLEIRLTPEDPPDRRGDVAGRERGRRDLIQQRRKDVMVAPIDQHDFDRRVPQRARGPQSAESPADDHDSRLCRQEASCALTITGNRD